MKTHFCITCGTEQGYVGEISDYIYCDRCGAKIYSDGSSSYDASRGGIKQMQDNIGFYDSGERDRNDYNRRHRR
jgi:hypothetical protein